MKETNEYHFSGTLIISLIYIKYSVPCYTFFFLNKILDGAYTQKIAQVILCWQKSCKLLSTIKLDLNLKYQYVTSSSMSTLGNLFDILMFYRYEYFFPNSPINDIKIGVYNSHSSVLHLYMFVH